MGRAWRRLGFRLVKEEGKDDPDRRKSLMESEMQRAMGCIWGMLGSGNWLENLMGSRLGEVRLEVRWRGEVQIPAVLDRHHTILRPFHFLP